MRKCIININITFLWKTFVFSDICFFLILDLTVHDIQSVGFVCNIDSLQERTSFQKTPGEEGCLITFVSLHTLYTVQVPRPFEINSFYQPLWIPQHTLKLFSESVAVHLTMSPSSFLKLKRLRSHVCSKLHSYLTAQINNVGRN